MAAGAGLGPGRRFASDPGILALGTPAPGLGGHEPILSPERLARDLDLALEVGARAVVLYRLGGLTPQHLAVLDRYGRHHHQLRPGPGTSRSDLTPRRP